MDFNWNIFGYIIAFITENKYLRIESFIISVISVVMLLGCFSAYYCDKMVSNEQIVVLEERNNEILEQIEPFVEQYLKYEKDSYKELKLDANTVVALSAYPELKGNEFIMKQIDIVLENQKQIAKLKLDIAGLEVYRPWLFMGK